MKNLEIHTSWFKDGEFVCPSAIDIYSAFHHKSFPHYGGYFDIIRDLVSVGF